VREQQSVSKRVLAQVELGFFALQTELAEGGLIRNHVSEDDCVVVSAGFDHELARDPPVFHEIETGCIVMIADGAGFPGYQLIRFIRSRGSCLRNLYLRTERPLAL